MRTQTPRYLHLSSSLRNALLLYRIRHSLSREPVIDGGELHRIEKELGTCLPDNVLATLAAVGTPLSEVLCCREQALGWPDFPVRYAAFARQSSDQTATFWCTLVARQPLARLGVYRWIHGSHGKIHVVTTAAWVTECYDLSPPADDELTLIRRLSVQFYPRIESSIDKDPGLCRPNTNEEMLGM